MRKMSLLLIAGVFGLFLVFFGGSEANAYSGAVSVKSIGIEEFVRDGYAEAVRNNSSIVVRGVFSLPNCTAVGGMMDGLVGGFDMDRSGNVIMDNKTTDITNEDALTAMLHNTFYLQRLMDCSYGDIYSLVDERGALRPEKEDEARELISNTMNGGTTITLPEGVFYFVAGGEGAYGDYALRASNGVRIVGQGGKKEEERKSNSYSRNTTLKPYSTVEDFSKRGKWGGLDMFHHNLLLDVCKFDNGVRCRITPQYAWNNIRMALCPGISIEGSGNDSYYTGYTDNTVSCMRDSLYLENADYASFVIDSEKALSNIYDTSGKGFMLDVVRNSDWENLVVRNTDGTCIAMDNPVNGTIKDSKAEGCGKMAKSSDGGASGFGIGTGYSDEGSLTISGSAAYNSTKFGFFFEHQSRFDGSSHSAKTAKSTGDAYKVVDSYAENNRFNFGGMRANDAEFVNNTSRIGNKTKLHVYFDDDSRRVSTKGIKMEPKASFTDVVSGSYYERPVRWAEEMGITNGMNEKTFGVGQKLMRKDAVTFLWRMLNRPGEVLIQPDQEILTCFNDIPVKSSNKSKGAAYFVPAVKWAFEKKIIVGTKACSSPTARDGQFSPEQTLNRAEYVTMLWRAAGEPKATGAGFSDVTNDKYYYDAVIWARSKGITNGVTSELFMPNGDCTREQAITMLYRFYQKNGLNI